MSLNEKSKQALAIDQFYPPSFTVVEAERKNSKNHWIFKSPECPPLDDKKWLPLGVTNGVGVAPRCSVGADGRIRTSYVPPDSDDSSESEEEIAFSLMREDVRKLLSAAFIAANPEMKGMRQMLSGSLSSSRSSTSTSTATSQSARKSSPVVKRSTVENIAAVAASAGVQTAMASPEGKALSGAAVKAGKLIDEVTKFWENKSVRLLVLSCAAAAAIKALKVLFRTARGMKIIQIARTFIGSWLNKLSKMFPMEGLKSVVFKLMEAVGLRECKNDLNVIVANPEMNTTEVLNSAMYAFSGLVAAATLPALGRNLTSLSKTARSIYTVDRGLKSLKGGLDYLLGCMPSIVQRFVFDLVGIGSIDEAVRQVHTEASTMIVKQMTIGQTFWSYRFHREAWKNLMLRMEELTTRRTAGTTNKLSWDLLRDSYSSLRKLKPDSIPTEEQKCSIATGVFLFGPAGLGKTVFANNFGCLLGANSMDSVWSVPTSNDHDDGFRGQPVHIMDDFGSVNVSQEAKSRFLANILTITSNSITLIKAADLSSKGMVNSAEYFFVTTNDTREAFASHYRFPEAFERRMYSKSHVVLEFVPTDLVKGTDGKYNPALVQTLTTEEIVACKHVNIILWRYDRNGNKVKRVLLGRDDAYNVILKARKTCVEKTDFFESAARREWEAGGRCYEAAKRAEREVNARFPEEDVFGDGKKYIVVPVTYRAAYARQLSVTLRATMDSKHNAGRTSGRGKLKEKKEGNHGADGFEFPAFEDLEAKEAQVATDAPTLLSKLRATGLTTELAPAQVRLLMGHDLSGRVGGVVRANFRSFGLNSRKLVGRVNDFIQDKIGMSLSTLACYLTGGLLVISVVSGWDDSFIESANAWKHKALEKFDSVLDLAEGRGTILVSLRKDQVSLLQATVESLHPKPLRARRSPTSGTVLRPASQISARAQMEQPRPVGFLENPTNRGRAGAIARNTVRLTTRNGTASATFIASNVFVANVHSFAAVSPDRDGYPVYLPSQDYNISTNNTPTRAMRTVAANLDPRDVSITDVKAPEYASSHGYNPISDVAYVVMPRNNGLPAFKTLKGYFLPRSVWPELKGCQGYLIAYDGAVVPVGPLSIMENKFWHSPAFDAKTGRLVSRAFHTGHDYLFLYPGVDGRSGNGPGRCGQTLCVDYKNQLWAIGAHAAQYGDTKYGMACAIDVATLTQTALTSASFVEAKSELRPVPLFQSETFERVQPLATTKAFGNAVVLGLLKKPGHIPRESKMYSSPLVTAGFPELAHSPYVPADLTVDMSDRLEQNYVNHEPVDMDFVLLGECFDDTLGRLGPMPNRSACPIRASFSGFMHPLCPFSNLSPVDHSTSAGRRRQIKGRKGKKHCLIDCGGFYEPDERLTNDVVSIKETCREGLCSETWSLFYKDECIRADKVVAGRTRVIRIPTTAMTLANRSEFAPVLDAFLSRGPHSESALGMNPESREFSVFARKLLDGGDHEGFFDADVVAMDDSHRWEILSTLAKALNRLFPDRERDQIRWNLFMSQFMRFEVIGDYLAFVKGQLPSGSTWTTFVNVVVIVSLLKYSFVRSQQEKGALASLEFFHRCVRAAALGDDLIANSNRNLSSFSPADYVRFASRCDKGNPIFDITSGDKIRGIGWVPFSEVSFLSRKFRRGMLPGYPGFSFLPVFSEKRALKSLAWFREGELGVEELTLAKCNNLLLLMLGHGPRKFHHYRDRFVRAFAFLGYEGRLRTWRDCATIWDKPEVAVSHFILAHPEMNSAPATSMATSAPQGGIVVSEKQAAEKVAVSVPVRTDRSVDAVGEIGWQYSTMVERPQNVGTFIWREADNEGEILARLDIPGDAIVGTHKSPFSQFKQFSSGVCNVTVRTQGNPTLAGCLVAYVCPLYPANVAVRITESKTTQTFLQHMMIRPQSADALTLEVPFYYYRDAFRVGDQPYAQVIIRVFNRLRVPPGSSSPFNRVTFNILTSFKGARFTLLNPTPSLALEDLKTARESFVKRHSLKTQSSSRRTRKITGANRRKAKAQFIKAKSEMLSGVLSSASNVGKSILSTVDVVSSAARAIGLDNPNVGASAEQRVNVPPYLSNVNGVSYFNHMSLNGAPKTAPPHDEHFGVGDETTFERVCRPTFKERIVFPVDSEAGEVLTSGYLTCAPTLYDAAFECSFQPLSCGFMSARFNTWRADIRVNVDFILPTFTTFRIAFVALPGVFDLPTDISEVSSAYVTYKQVSGEEASHSFLIPYQSDTKRKYVPNGPPSLDTCFGRWMIFLVSEVSVAEGTVDPNYEMNVYFGLENVCLDNWGLRNDTLFVTSDDIPVTQNQSIVMRSVARRGKENKDFIYVEKSKEKTKFKACEIQATPEMLQTTGMSTAEASKENGRSETVSAAMSSSTATPLDAGISDINQLLKRMVPVAFLSSAEVGNGDVLSIDIGNLFKTELNVLNRLSSQLSYFGSMFAAFRGGMRVYALTRAQNCMVLFRQGERLSGSDARELGGYENAQTVHTTSGPWQVTNPHMGRHIMATSPWISINRFAVVPKALGDEEPVEIGTYHFFTEGSSGLLRVFAGFADTARISIPVNVPRFSVRSFNVGGDKYASGHGSYRIGEFIDFLHVDTQPVFAFSQLILEKALTSEPIDGSLSPDLARPAGLIRLQTTNFSIEDLRAMGFPIPDQGTLAIEPNMISEITLDLKDISCVPINTVLKFNTTAVDDFTQLTTRVILQEQRPAVEGVFGSLFEVGETALIQPPWADAFLNEVYGVDVTTSSRAVPRPVAVRKEVNPLNIIQATDGNDYGRVSDISVNTGQVLVLN